MPPFIFGFWFFLGKKPKIFKYSNAAFSATFGRIDFGIGAFESLWSIFLKSEQKNFTCPHFPLISVAFEEGLRTKNAKICDFRPSSNTTEIKGKWGRTKIFIFSQSTDQDLSNAPILKIFGLKFVKINNFEICVKSENFAF